MKKNSLLKTIGLILFALSMQASVAAKFSDNLTVAPDKLKSGDNWVSGWTTEMKARVVDACNPDATIVYTVPNPRQQDKVPGSSNPNAVIPTVTDGISPTENWRFYNSSESNFYDAGISGYPVGNGSRIAIVNHIGNMTYLPLTSAGGELTLNLTGNNLNEATEIKASVAGKEFYVEALTATTARVKVEVPANTTSRDKSYSVTFTIDGAPYSYIPKIIVPAGNPHNAGARLILQYDSPAPSDENAYASRMGTPQGYRNWQQWTLPIGNGYSGANIYGAVDREWMQISEESLWTGGPVNGGTDTYNDNRANGVIANSGSKITPDIYKTGRELALGKSGNNTPPEATAIGLQMKKMYPAASPSALGAYQNFAEVYYHFKHENEAIRFENTDNYLRWLNIESAVSGVSYTYKGVDYNREYLASYPDRVIVTKFSASNNGKLAFTLNPTIPHVDGVTDPGANANIKDNVTVTADATAKTITLQGRIKGNGLLFAGKFEIITDGNVSQGTMSGNGTLIVDNATEAVIILSVGTNYENDYDKRYRTGETKSQLLDKISDRLAAASAKGYNTLKERHVADYKKIFDLVELNLGGNYSNMMTNALLTKYKSAQSPTTTGTNTNAPVKSADLHFLEELYFQYGRYLLIASSREGTLPANLQGVWNREHAPPWESDYHLNINLQMNYWPANNTNMPEQLKTLVEYIDAMRKPGRVGARSIFGVDANNTNLNDQTGWVAFVHNNPFGFTGVWRTIAGDNGQPQWSPESAAWLTQNVYDMYQYYPDEDYLRNKIYPIIREAALFYSHPEVLVSDPVSGRMVMSPAYSSEHGPMWGGTTFQQQLLWQLFTNVIEAATILNIDTELRATLTSLLPQLSDPGAAGPVPVGATSGRTGGVGGGAAAANAPGVKEWWWETSYYTTLAGAIPGTESNHRHLSHLVGLFPGNLITKDKTEWMQAAKNSLNIRGDDATGWSRGNKTNLWARTGDGNRAYKILDGLINSATFENLWDYHSGPYFQIDGNLGGTAGIVIDAAKNTATFPTVKGLSYTVTLGATSITEVKAETKDPVVAVCYYDLMGREITRPSTPGIYILKKIHLSKKNTTSKEFIN